MSAILRILKSFLFWVLITAIAIGGIGAWIGYLISNAAQQNQTCSPSAETNSWKGISISGLASALQLPFGYGRGTQVIDSTLNATPQEGTTLPASITVLTQPLVSSDGTRIIQPLSAATSQSKVGISAVAIRAGESSTYQLQVCIRAPSAAPGSYSSQLLFPGATVTTGTSLPVTTATSLPVTVTFQSRSVPYILTVGVVPLTFLGILYSALILIRRNNPGLALGQVDGKLNVALLSVNGIIALILGLGAVFAAWNVQCYRDPTWGTPWPTILLALATMAGAAAGAATIPLSLSSSTGSLMANQESLNVQQGHDGQVGISLSAAPSGNVTVTTSRTSGNSSLSVTGGPSLTFTPSDFSTVQNVTIHANQDADLSKSAKFTIRATGYAPITITAKPIN
jgi:hypothetical protein